MAKKQISVVIPIYQEEKNIQPLYQRLEEVTGAIDGYKWEYIFVNDGSVDGSYAELLRLAGTDPKVRVIDLSRNFGKEIALSAGVHSVGSDAVICMDADLQHPPEMIPEMIEEWQQGADVVAAIRVDIKGQPMLRRVGSFLYYKLMSGIASLDMAAKSTDFRLCDKRVIEAFRTITEKERLFRGIVDWLGFKKKYIEFRAPERNEGAAAYSYGKLWKLAVNSIVSYSLIPLKLTGYLGLLITISTSLLLVWMVLANYVFKIQIFTPLAMFVVFNTFLFGIVLIGLGLIALYIGTIHTEVINRPLYIVRERVNFSHSDRGDVDGI